MAVISATESSELGCLSDALVVWVGDVVVVVFPLDDFELDEPQATRSSATTLRATTDARVRRRVTGFSD
jgi:hypothetical protein